MKYLIKAIFLKEVDDANRFGVATIENGRITKVVEKPKDASRGHAVTGLYLYDSTVFDVIKTLKPSGRGELEITDVNNHYITTGTMHHTVLKGQWTDSGTFESLYRANTIARDLVRAGRTTPFDNTLHDREHKTIAQRAAEGIKIEL